MRIFKYFSIFLILTAIGYYLFVEKSPYTVMSGQTMGTYYNIKLKSSGKDNDLHTKIKQRLEQINKEMSVFDPQSEISKINNAKAGEWVELSPEMAQVMKDAYQAYKLSNGAFDPTVGKLVDLWGFGAGTPKTVPTKEEINNVLKYTGFDKIKFADNYSRLKKTHDDTYINLSAIAKGYGTDKIAELLEAEGFRDFVVEIGGEVVARGQRDDEVKGWNIGVVKPSKGQEENSYIITLKNSAVATSGDYRNYFYVDNKKYSHTISPKTGYPVEHNLASATVFYNNCMDADAIATSIMSMGEKKALKFANDNKIAVIMFVRDGDENMQTILSEKAKKLVGE